MVTLPSRGVAPAAVSQMTIWGVAGDEPWAASMTLCMAICINLCPSLASTSVS